MESPDFCGEVQVAVAAERERCAKVCDELARHALCQQKDGLAPWDTEGALSNLFLRHHALAASNCAQEIRARALS